MVPISVLWGTNFQVTEQASKLYEYSAVPVVGCSYMCAVFGSHVCTCEKNECCDPVDWKRSVN